MTASPPTVKSYMTASPHSIDEDGTMPDAQRMMHAHGLRHLPVLSKGTLCGIVSERDLLLAETLIGFDVRRVPVSDAMTKGVYIVAPTELLSTVSAEMAEEKYGCAVVMESGQVVGILTTTDICRALAETLVAP